MKKAIIMVLLLSTAAFGFAQEETSTFSLELGPVVSIGFPALPEGVPQEFSTLWMITTLRGGAYLDFMFNLNKTVHFGVESGVLFMTLSFFGDEVGEELGGTTMLDIPVRGFARFTFGGFFVQPFAGVYIPVLPGGSMFFDVGAKIGFGKGVKFFLEGDYLIGPGGYPRVGLGLLFTLFNF